MAYIPHLTGLAALAQKVGDVIDTYQTVARTSLTSYTKTANVMSRLYIEDSIMRDDICVPLVGTLNQLYVSYILAALNLETKCANGRTVREQFELVATENYDIIDEILNNFGKTGCTYSNEETVVQLEPNTQRLPVGRVIELTMTGVTALKAESTVVKTGGDTKTTEATSPTTKVVTALRRDKDNNPIIGPDGKPIHDTRTTEKGTKGSEKTTTQMNTTDTTKGYHESTYQFKAYLYVQLIPYVLTPDVVSGYIGANFAPPVSRRWTKFKAGEISFWKDFILARDIIRKQKKILKQDKHGIILGMMAKQRSSLYHWWEGILSLVTAGQGQSIKGIRGMSHNLANTILITSKATFDRTCRELGMNFENATQRQKFFNKTWSMIVCVVDPLYNTVDMYFNGVDYKGSYNFAMINKVGAKGQDNFDLKEVMSAFSQGLTPKF